MRCDWHVPACFFPVPKRDLDAAFGASAALSALASVQGSRRQIFGGVPVESRHFFVRFRHELDHLQKIHGTTFGLLYRLVADRVVRHFEMVVRLAASSQSGLRFPLEHQGPGLKMLRRRDLDFEGLIASLDGATGIPMVCFWATGVRTALAILRRGCRSRAELVVAQAFLKQVFGDGFQAATPERLALSFDGFGRAEGARLTTEHLLETSAVVQQFHWTGQVAGEPGSMDRMLTGSAVYQYLFRLWHAVFPEASVPVAAVESERFSAIQAALPVQFYALLDIALMPPLEPGQLNGQRPWSLADLDPGLRFSAGMSWLKESGRELTGLASAYADADFEEFTNACCAAMAWPTPQELGSSWLDGLATSVGGPVSHHYIGQRQDDSMEIVEELMGWRRRSPLRAAVGALQAEEVPRSRFRMWVCQESDGLEPGPTCGGMSADLSWSKFYLCHTAFDLFFPDSALTIPRLRPSRMIEAALYSFSQIGVSPDQGIVTDAIRYLTDVAP